MKSDERSMLGILLRFSTPSQETKSLVMAPNEYMHRFGDMYFLPCLRRTKSDWTVHETNLIMDGHTLTEISALCCGPDDLAEETNTGGYFALLGHISIKDLKKTKLFPPASSWVVEAHNVEIVPGDSGSRTLSCKLEWKLKQPEEDYVFTRYNVYAEKLISYRTRKVMEEPRNEKVFLGTAHVDAYYVSGMVVGSDVKKVRFVIQTCGEDGSWQELDASPSILVEAVRQNSSVQRFVVVG